jgi:hypothetical protein
LVDRRGDLEAAHEHGALALDTHIPGVHSA